MISIKLAAGLLVVVALAQLNGPVPGQSVQAKKRLVDLDVEVGNKHHGCVVLSGDGFVTVRDTKPGKNRYFNNFRASSYSPLVDGKLMGRDPDGKDGAIQACAKQTDDTKWEYVGGRSQLRLRAPSGPYKGWWVGLAPPEKAKRDREIRCKLILVKDKKDAAVFSWEDPYDDGK